MLSDCANSFEANMSDELILNCTQHNVTEDQVIAGVIERSGTSWMQHLAHAHF